MSCSLCVGSGGDILLLSVLLEVAFAVVLTHWQSL